MKKLIYKLYVKLRRKSKNFTAGAVEFNQLLEHSSEILVLLPRSTDGYNGAIDFAVNLSKLGKKITVFLSFLINVNELRYNDIKKFEYHDYEFTKSGIPRKMLVNRLKQKKYDLIIDLDRDDYSSVSLLTVYPVSVHRVGFRKLYSEKFYNFILAAGQDNAGNYDKLFELIKRI